MAMNLKVGDLVSYQGAGMYKKTLGMVIDVIEKDKYYKHGRVLIEWYITGKFMPRVDSRSWQAAARGVSDFTGMQVWHEYGNWFKVVQNG